MKRLIFTLLFFIQCQYILAQHPYSLEFQTLHRKLLEQKEGVHIEVFKFYISNIKYKKQGKIVAENQNFYKLVDLSKDTIQQVETNSPNHLLFDEIEVQLGIDSNTNKQGVHAGDLDPMNGMYWSWQSGYINIKLEGNSPKCNTRLHQFQFHLGGFLPKQYAQEFISITTFSANKAIVKIDLWQLFSGIDLEKENSVMIPGEEAKKLSRKISNCFRN